MDQDDQLWIERSYQNCSGCRRCEISCSLYHEGKIWPEASRIRIFMLVPGIEIPHLCFQCEDYPCVEACPEGALSVIDQTGAVDVDGERCTACRLCITACPGNVPHLHPDGTSIVICNLCDGEPRCVNACLEGGWNALTLLPREKGISYELAATPQELTKKVANQILGEKITKEVLG